MKVTSKSLYCLHFLCALGQKQKAFPNKPVHLREIAEEYHIPFKFLEQIAILMKSFGFVKGSRGKSGGYLLNEEPSKLSLARILSATEGRFLPLVQIDGGNTALTEVLEEVFEENRKKVESRLSQITLSTLIEQVQNRSEPAYMYYV